MTSDAIAERERALARSIHLVEPEVRNFIEAYQKPELSLPSLPKLRAFARNLFQQNKRPPAAGVHVYREVAPGFEKGPDVPVVVYAPSRDTAQPRAALLHIHGGGYVAGSPEAEAEWSEWLVRELGCVVIAPQYRLAPDTPHPGPVTDCYSALVWLRERAKELAVDPERIGVFGGSSGGGLAAAVALMARDRKHIPLSTQCLLYPMLDDRTGVGSDTNPYAGEYVWTISDNIFGWRSLLGREPGGGGVSAYASPARATDLTGLPETYIWVGALDLFVDESIEYARRLLRAGVPTELHVYPGVTHGNILVADAPSSKVCRAEMLRALQRSRIGEATTRQRSER